MHNYITIFCFRRSGLLCEILKWLGKFCDICPNMGTGLYASVGLFAIYALKSKIICSLLYIYVKQFNLLSFLYVWRSNFLWCQLVLKYHSQPLFTHDRSLIICYMTDIPDISETKEQCYKYCYPIPASENTFGLTETCAISR